MFWTLEKIEARLIELKEARFVGGFSIGGLEWREGGAEIGERPPTDGRWMAAEKGHRWAGRDRWYWLRADVDFPADWPSAVGRFVFGDNNTGNVAGFESLLFVDGAVFQGVDANHTEVFFPPSLNGKRVRLDFRLWSGLGGYRVAAVPEHRIIGCELSRMDESADRLYFRALAAIQAIRLLSEDDPTRVDLLADLDRAFSLIDWSLPGTDGFYAEIASADAFLSERNASKRVGPDYKVTCVGHTHIDVAWLWRIAHTREKAARSFSTALRLLEQYPDFRFLQTQPQLYAFLKEDYPELYERIRDAVRSGRWEAGGAMWLEADCNIPSGESLVRQILFGKRFLRREFGVDCEYLWLPDVFGYSAALPQILLKSGIKLFVTTKISWNQYNRMPHDTFFWRGIDGSEVLAHFITTPDPSGSEGSFYYTYNGVATAETVRGIWSAYRDKEVSRELLLALGYGDGGGGTTRDMLELRSALDKTPGMPRVGLGRADEYFGRLLASVGTTDRFVHVWDGELYLELHRGTYTSQAAIKRANRKLELSLRKAEIARVLAGKVGGPGDGLAEAWRILLRNQFHDIIPGSSIREVYEDAASEHHHCREIAEAADAAAWMAIAPENGALVFNPHGRPVSGLVRLPASYSSSAWFDGPSFLVPQSDGDALYLHVQDVPSLGYAVLVPGCASAETALPFVVDGNRLETPFYLVEWDSTGRIARLYDRENNREVLAPGHAANEFQVFQDRPKSRHEAWDIDIFYQDTMEAVEGLESFVQDAAGPLFVSYRILLRYRSSLIEQRVKFYAHDRRIDFETRIDWHESRRLLKVAFPVLVRSVEAVYDIQFGNVKRPTHWNTSWDQARFEVPAQQWADLSERGYGVALLNDCKYGYDVKDNVLRLTLLKSAKVPDPEADQGPHEFVYSLLPHAGDWAAGGVAESAAELNDPLLFRASAPAADLPNRVSLFSFSMSGIVVDAVKPAEEGKAAVLRFHENSGARGEVSVGSDFTVESWCECDLLENPLAPALPGSADARERFKTRVGPYEIKTFLVEFAR